MSNDFDVWARWGGVSTTDASKGALKGHEVLASIFVQLKKGTESNTTAVSAS